MMKLSLIFDIVVGHNSKTQGNFKTIGNSNPITSGKSERVFKYICMSFWSGSTALKWKSVFIIQFTGFSFNERLL